MLDAEYHIWYQDNSTGWVPGPSDYSIRLALKVKADSIDSWIRHLEPSTRRVSIDQWNDLRLDNKKWELASKPELYHSSLKTEVKVVFRKENVIFGVYSTMPIHLEYLEE